MAFALRKAPLTGSVPEGKETRSFRAALKHRHPALREAPKIDRFFPLKGSAFNHN